MLVACSACHHQFDVGDLSPGSQVRCHCGQSVRIPVQRARDAIIAHCSSCGAHLEKDARACGYCKSEVSAVDHQVGEICPECFARLLKGAHFCSGCGVEIRPEVIHDVPAGLNCPRCTKSLRRRPVRGGSLGECCGCGGIWLAQEFFERVVEDRDAQAVAMEVREHGRDPSRQPLDAEAVRYAPCPVCEKFMHRKNFAGRSGVVIDWCSGHGYWFDPFELERILDFVASGGLDRARIRKIEEQKRELERQKDRRHHQTPISSGDPRVPSMEYALWDSGGSGLFDALFDFVWGLFRR